MHGDAAALTAVLEWLDNRGIREVICAGDIAGFGPFPNRCISMLAERNVRTIMGNADFDILHPREVSAQASRRVSEIAEIREWTRRQLSDESQAFLRSLPFSLEVQGGILVVHGSTDNMAGIVDQNSDPQIPNGVKVVLAGHLHVPFVIRQRNGLWVNVGSAGRSCDGDPRPAVSLITESKGKWTVSQHRVHFDARVSARDILESGMPFAQNVASAVLEARWYRSESP